MARLFNLSLNRGMSMRCDISWYRYERSSGFYCNILLDKRGRKGGIRVEGVQGWWGCKDEVSGVKALSGSSHIEPRKSYMEVGIEG